MTNEPRLSRRANQDLIDLAKYVARDNPVAAANLLERLEGACQQLADSPSLSFPVDGAAKGLLIWPVAKYVIIYRIEVDMISVLRIVHGARDLGRLLGESQ